MAVCASIRSYLRFLVMVKDERRSGGRRRCLLCRLFAVKFSEERVKRVTVVPSRAGVSALLEDHMVREAMFD